MRIDVMMGKRAARRVIGGGGRTAIRSESRKRFLDPQLLLLECREQTLIGRRSPRFVGDSRIETRMAGNQSVGMRIVHREPPRWLGQHRSVNHRKAFLSREQMRKAMGARIGATNRGCAAAAIRLPAASARGIAVTMPPAASAAGQTGIERWTPMISGTG